MFEQINGALICDPALKTEGGAGHLGLMQQGGDSRSPLSARSLWSYVRWWPWWLDACICCHFVDPLSLAAFTACFPTLGHNDIRDITASMLTEVCHKVRVEPELQPLTGEEMQHKIANMELRRCSFRHTCQWFLAEHT